jgi:hypothetical protein
LKVYLLIPDEGELTYQVALSFRDETYQDE